MSQFQVSKINNLYLRKEMSKLQMQNSSICNNALHDLT
jgi:hypothetical protein